MGSLWLKLFIIGVLTFALVVPLALLRGLVGERQQRAAEVVAEIAASASRSQILTGPLLVVDAERRFHATSKVMGSGQERTVVEERREVVRSLLAPRSLALHATLRTERRSRGIFASTLYHAAIQTRGSIGIPVPQPLQGDLIGYRVLGAKLVLGLGDARGIQQIRLHLGGRELPVEAGGPVAWLPDSVHASLPPDMLQPGWLDFAVDLDLSGTESLAVVPLGGDNQMSLRADWPHPGFAGSYLPASHQIVAAGFRADWKVSRLASQAQQRLGECAADRKQCPGLLDTAFRVRLLDPVDRYLKTDRAMKFSLVVLVLVFGAVFFIEVLKRVRVHPIQYGLTGAAVAMFFLLLLSLAEHVGFGIAYLLAAAACIGLIGAYMAGVLGSRASGLGFAGLLAGLYALLYGVLQSEDYALLMGALALFALLTFVMLATSRLDWSSLGSAAPRRGETAPEAEIR